MIDLRIRTKQRVASRRPAFNFDIARTLCRTRYSQRGTNTIGLNFQQIEGSISGTVGVDNRTLGWGMTLMHELHHTQVGGGLRDTPGNPGPVVTQMNIIRSELNSIGGNYGQRLEYSAQPMGSYSYIPFSTETQRMLRGGLIPGAMPTDKFLRIR